MEPKTYNFQNPDIRAKASQKARTAPRPKSYYSRSKRVHEAKQELIKIELVKQGFLQQVGSALPKINAALIKNACDPKRGAADRKTVYTALGFYNKEGIEPQQTIGQVLADLYAQSEERAASKF